MNYAELEDESLNDELIDVLASLYFYSICRHDKRTRDMFLGLFKKRAAELHDKCEKLGTH